MISIEYKFVQKAISEKNYISFFYKKTKYKNVKAQKLDEFLLSTNNGTFNFNELTKIQILKERF